MPIVPLPVRLLGAWWERAMLGGGNLSYMFLILTSHALQNTFSYQDAEEDEEEVYVTPTTMPAGMRW